MKINLFVSLIFASNLCLPAFAEVRVGADLSPEQAEVVARARESNPRLAWRVLTKEVKGKPRTVVVLGEQESTLPADTMIAKKVIDQFEHFAVEASGPHLDRDSPQESPDSHAPMNLPPLGARVKTIQNAEANLKVSELVAGALFGLGYFAMTGYFSGRYFVDGFSVRPAMLPQTAYNTVMLGLSFIGGVTMLALLSSASDGGQRQKAVAEFVDAWVKDPQFDRPMVLIVKREYVDEIERELVDRHGFESQAPAEATPT